MRCCSVTRISPKIIVATQTSGRSHRQLERQIGCFVNTLVLRARICGADRADEVIRNVSHTLSEAVKHGDYPFDRLLEDLRARHGAEPSPLFDIQIDYAPNLHRRQLRGAGGLSITEANGPKQSAKFALSFLIGEPATGDGLAIEIVYNTRLYRRDSVNALSARLRRVLQSFVEEPARPIDAFALNEATAAPRRVEINLNLPD